MNSSAAVVCRLATPVQIMYGKSVKLGKWDKSRGAKIVTGVLPHSHDPYISRTYHIEAELGLGGSGAVYLAWHKRLQKHVVIKVIQNDIEGTLEVRRNEVEALKNIKNTYVPQVFDFLVEGDSSFTIMEYIEGENFDKHLSNGKIFTEKQIIKWYYQLASALDAIHNFNVYHRDIKPSNIMLTLTGDACLIDFNSALVSGNNTGIVSRSMGYASPEQYEYFKLCRSSLADKTRRYADYIETVLLVGDCITDRMSHASSHTQSKAHEIDWKLSDIYSLGATMYHFLTGKRPPVRADEVKQIPNLKGYSEGILNIIEKSMKTNPNERFASAEELIEALGECAAK